MILAFPKRLGTVVPLDSVVPRKGLVEGSEDEATTAIPPGTLLYSLRRASDEEAIGGSEAGCLYMLIEPYNGLGPPLCAEMLRSDRSVARDGASFRCDMGRDGRKGDSLDKGQPWRPLSCQLWIVNHFATQRRALGNSAVMWSKVMFDFRSAEVEIRRRAQAIDDFEIPRGLSGDASEPEALSEVDRRDVLGPEAQGEFRAESGRQPVDDLQPMSGLEARREPASPQRPRLAQEAPFLGAA